MSKGCPLLVKKTDFLNPMMPTTYKCMACNADIKRLTKCPKED